MGFQESESGGASVSGLGFQEMGSRGASVSWMGFQETENGFQHTGVLIQPSNSNFIPDPPARRRIFLGFTGTPGSVDIPLLVSRLFSNVLYQLIEKKVQLLTDDDETRMWADERKMLHGTLSSWAEQIYVVVPASSDVLTKVSLGRSDDLLSRTIRSFTGQVFLMADMDPGSYRNGSTTKCGHKFLKKGYTEKYPLMQPSTHTWTMGPMGYFSY